jgi:hypothetical protein
MRAPFDEHGNLMHYARPESRQESHGYEDAHEWRDVETFEASLTIGETYRGRSAAYFMWSDVLGHKYPMFMTDIADLIRRGCIEFGTVHDGMWVVRKRGQNYGIRMAP